MPSGADDVLTEAGERLAEQIVAAVPGWVQACIADTLAAAGAPFGDDLEESALEAGRQAARWVGDQLAALLSADVDAQWATPLQVVRLAVRFPTEVLERAGPSPVRRDRFAEERFPDDPYGLTPGSLAVLGPGVGELALVWGAAKAAAHRARHQGPTAAPD